MFLPDHLKKQTWKPTIKIKIKKPQTIPRRNGARMEGKNGAWLAQWVEHAILDLRVVSLSPTLGVEITLKKTLMFIYF